MLDKKRLIEIAKTNNLKPHQQEKHYIQTSLLNILSDYPVVFKGGTYLWFFHGLNRFSTDLDFTNNDSKQQSIEDIKKTAKKLSQDLEKKMWLLDGIKIKTKINNLTKESVSIKIIAQGPLYTNENSSCFVDLDISYREKIILPIISQSLNTFKYNQPIKIIKGMNLKEVFAEKIRAIITRKSINSQRDIYDLYFLISKHNLKINFEILEIINEKLKYYNTKFNKNIFNKKILDKKENFKELNDFVFDQVNDFDYYYNYIMKNIYAKEKKICVE